MNFISGLLLQINVASVDTNTVITETVEQTEEMTLSVWSMALKGGWIMIPIALLSIIAVYLFIERLIAIGKARKEQFGFMNTIKENIQDGKVEDALNLCKSTNGPLARMIEKGVSRIGKPLDDINTAIENVGRIEITKLEKGLATLATVSGAAPMIGFLAGRNVEEVRNTHINIGTGVEISIQDLAILIKETIGFGGELKFDSSKPDGTLRKLTDVSKLHALGWMHKMEIDEGVQLLYNWYKNSLKS